ncbi:MAG: hypothetical protein CL680_21420 [Blastomonas sp.]|nr:hypothetical protein [Blastomonas sp.]|tara:strand:- start:12462 stop:13397 length:936 start_codon:yes stop_codon:yes gene_type:complete
MMNKTKLRRKLVTFVSNSPPFFYNIVNSLVLNFDNRKINSLMSEQKIPVLIYQQGRVASTSVYESLKNSFPHIPIYHLHTLSAERADEELRKLKGNNERSFHYLHLGKIFGKLINSRAFKNKKEPWKVITIFRDPIEILMSLYILHLEKNEEKIISAYGSLSEQNSLKYIKEKMEADDPRNWEIVTWFDSVFKKEIGVDIFAKKFDPVKGYQIIKNDNFEVLIMKFEELSKAYKYGVSELLGLPVDRLDIEYTNLHNNKSAADLQRYIRSELRFNEKFLDQIFDSKVYKHFYSSQQLTHLKSKWLEKTNEC